MDKVCPVGRLRGGRVAAPTPPRGGCGGARALRPKARLESPASPVVQGSGQEPGSPGDEEGQHRRVNSGESDHTAVVEWGYVLRWRRRRVRGIEPPPCRQAEI